MTAPYSGRGAQDIRYAPIDVSGTGDTVILVSPGGRTRLQAYQLFLVAGAATTIRWKSGATNLTGPVSLSALGSMTLDNIREPWFITAEGEDLVLNQTGTAVIGGVIGYFFVTPSP